MYKKKDKKGYISIEIIIIMAIMFITGLLIMGKWMRPGSDTLDKEKGAYKDAISRVVINGGSGGGGYVPVDPNPWPDQGGGGGQTTPDPSAKPEKPETGEPETEKITITFNSNGGNNIEAIEINKGDAIGNLPVPVKANYEFLGWYDGATKVEVTTTFNSSVTLNAQWQGNTISYTVKYVSDSGKAIGNETITGTFGENKLIAAPDKAGYVKPANKNVNFDSVSKEIILEYTRITYNITYDLQGGTGSNPTTYTVEDSVTLTAPSKTNYTFSGWTGANGNAPQANVTINPGATGDKSYVANWAGNKVNYTVKYVSESGKQLGSENREGTFGENITVIAPYKDGYIKPSDKTIIINSTSQIVEFVYQLEHYTISYDLQGGTADNDTSYTVENAVKLEAPTKDGNIFLGWTGSNGGAPQKDVTIAIGSTGNKSYIANWQELTYALVNGPTFNAILMEINNINYIKSIEFVDTVKPVEGVTEILGLDADNDGGIVSWYSVDPVDNKAKVYISTQNTEHKVIADADSSEMFLHLVFITIIDAEKLDVSDVTNMRDMFNYTGNTPLVTSFEIKGLNSWDTSNVTDMSNMFLLNGSYATTWDIGSLANWDTSKVTNMNSMFMYSGQRVAEWSVGDLSNWSIGNVTDMGNMFAYSGKFGTSWSVGNLSNWDVSNVTNVEKAFAGVGCVGDLSNWNVGNVTNMRYMFSGNGKGTATWNIGDLSNWDVSNVTDMKEMFAGAGSDTEMWSVGDIGRWDTSNVTNMNGMFQGVGRYATTFELDLSGWNTSNVTDTDNMFRETGYNTTTFNLDLSGWDTSSLTNMNGMFFKAGYNAVSFKIKGLDAWNTSSATSMSYVFSDTGHNATIWNVGDLSKWDVSNVTDMYSMFKGAGANAASWTVGNLNNWDVGNVTTMDFMFKNAGTNATTWSIGDLSSWNVNNVKSMVYMFSGAGRNATTWSIGNLSNWDTSNVTGMYGMFEYAGEKAEPFTLDLSNWDASNEEWLTRMFNSTGANKILTPKNIRKDVELRLNTEDSWVTERTWYDTTDGNKEYPAGTFPVGNGNVSHVLVDKKPEKNYMLVTGQTFNSKLSKIEYTNKIKSIEITDTVMPTSGVTEIVGLDLDNYDSIVGWYSVDPVDNMANVYISTQKSGQKVIANPDSAAMFNGIGANNKEANFYLNLQNLDTSIVEEMGAMFNGAGFDAKSFVIEGLETWDTSNVKSMAAMFRWAGESATTWSIGDLSNWDVSNVTNMNSMFAYSFPAAMMDIGDISRWDTSNVTNMSRMFSGSDNKTHKLDLSNWNVDKVTNHVGFTNSQNPETIIPPVWKN